MTTTKRILAGDTSRFALGVNFQRDPDDGAGATREEAISWGGIEIWVLGQNLCAHLEDEIIVENAHWYLLPVLEWLSACWDNLFHEERLPNRVAGDDSWHSLQATSQAPPSLDETGEESWEDQWQRWWLRHSLLACRQGGLFPDVMFRRWRDRVEVSWGQRRLAGQPDRFRFLADDGFARLPVVYVANPIYSVMREAVDYLISQEPKSEQFTKLQEGLESLKKNRKELRLALLAGLGRTTAEQEQRWKKVTSQLASNPNAEKAVITVSEPAQLFLEGSCQAALMFGTTAPTIDEDDAMALAGKLIDLYAPGSESPELQDLVREELISDRSKRPWALGYDLAQEILEELSLPGGRDESVDIEKVYDSLGIFIDDLPLKDIDIRAVSIAGPDHRPSTILNPNNSKYLGNAGRRFTLAHELCHILFDRSEGARLAIASGPWAPSDLEARANAFAAMFLMPTELIRRLLPGLSTPLYTVAGVAELSAKMQTSFRATLEHLVNLGFLTPEQHDRIEIEFEAVV